MVLHIQQVLVEVLVEVFRILLELAEDDHSLAVQGLVVLDLVVSQAVA